MKRMITDFSPAKEDKRLKARVDAASYLLDRLFRRTTVAVIIAGFFILMLAIVSYLLLRIEI